MNKAWDTKWKKTKKFKPKPIIIIIKPIWERVLKAITFFISTSIKAPQLEKNIVLKPKKNITFKYKVDFNKKLNFINKIKPAVTKVLLWTNALIGVGALIAFGNQPLKGKTALLVKAPLIKNITPNTINTLKLFLSPVNIKKIKKINKKKSPKRLVKTVLSEPLFLSQLL